MKLNKNEKNYLLITLFKSYIFQSAICSVIIVICTAVLHTGLTWILDRYVEHYYLIYRGLYVYMTALIIWVICIMCLTYKLLKKVVGYVYELQAATGRLFDKTGDYIELSPELSEIAVKINHLKQEAENNAKLAQENEQRKNDLIMYLAHDLKTPLSSVIGYLTLLRDDEQQSLLEYQWFRDIVSKSSYKATLPDESTQMWKNTNAFLDSTSDYYNGNVKGVKTGSLSDDYNLVVLYQQHGKEFLICSLGSKSNSSRYDDVNYIIKTIDESDYLSR